MLSRHFAMVWSDNGGLGLGSDNSIPSPQLYTDGDFRPPPVATNGKANSALPLILEKLTSAGFMKETLGNPSEVPHGIKQPALR